MEKVESALADTTSGSSPISSSIPSTRGIKEICFSSPVPRSSSALPLAGTSVDASGSTYHSIMHSSGKLVPIGIAHPVRKYSEEILEDTNPSPVELKKTPKRSSFGENDRFRGKEDCYQAKVRPVASEKSVRKPRQQQSSQRDITTKRPEEVEQSADFGGRPCSSSEDSSTPPSPQQTQAIPSRNESVMSTRDGSGSVLRALPRGKKCHVFISHSTADQAWVERSLVIPLENQSFAVSASYRFMPDASRYDDSKIQATIRESFVVVIGLSPHYVTSQRCAFLLL